MQIKHHAQFLLDKEIDNPTAKLRYRIKWSNNKNIVSFSVGYRVEIDKWSLETQRCKTNTTHGLKKVPASIINRKIHDLELACERVFTRFEAENIIPTTANFKESFNKEIGKTSKNIKEKNFFDIFDEFVVEESKLNQWLTRTHQKYATMRTHLYNFDPCLSLEKIDEDKLYDYLFYLQNELKHKNTTTFKHIAQLKGFLKWTFNQGYLKNDSFKNFQPKYRSANKKIIFLSNSELKIFKEYTIPDDKFFLEKVRDVFLFQCYTGLRYSDVENLKRNDVKESYIEITTLKTADSLIIELNKHSKSILDKYSNEVFDENKALPVISNQKMNDYIKELAELAGLDESIRETYYIGKKRYDEVYPKYQLLSTHAGRRTFICNALALGIPPQVVMKWTGHSDYKAMKPYIDVATEIKANEMSKFNLLF